MARPGTYHFAVAAGSSDHFWSADGSADPSIVAISPLPEISTIRHASAPPGCRIGDIGRNYSGDGSLIQTSQSDRLTRTGISTGAWNGKAIEDGRTHAGEMAFGPCRTCDAGGDRHSGGADPRHGAAGAARSRDRGGGAARGR